MDYRHLWLEIGVFAYIWALLWSISFASPLITTHLAFGSILMEKVDLMTITELK